MSEAENNRIKRVESEELQATNETQDEKRLSEFKWGDVDDEEIEGKLLEDRDEELIECVSLLSNHLLNNIAVEHFGEMDSSGMRFVIPVDLDLHTLLRKRFDEEWNLDSRLEMFQSIRENLMGEFSWDCLHGIENRSKLNAKIQEALPATQRKKFSSGDVSLEDDAMVVDDESNTICIEVPVHFEANL